MGVHDPQVKDLLALMRRNRDELNKVLSAQQRETFEKYIDCSDEYVLRMTELAFCDGFSLASKLLRESLCRNR